MNKDNYLSAFVGSVVDMGCLNVSECVPKCVIVATAEPFLG